MTCHKSSSALQCDVPTPCRIRAAALVVGLALALVSACTTDPAPSPTDIPTPTDFHFHEDPRGSSRGDDLVSVSTLVTKLDVPWGVAFLPDGGALVTERHKRRILKVGPGRDASGELTVRPLTSIEGVYANNEGGLLGIAVSPRFTRDKTIFIYYTTKKDNRIARVRLDGHPRPEAIVTGIPGAGVHNGGRLRFGPDGYLYASTGDASHAGGSQSLDNLGGKILRMTTDGKPAPGNPFKDSLIWSYGHRNPEGMAWDAEGRMYSAEIGEAVWDELNLITPGRNYGWPKVQGMGTEPAMTNPVAVWRPEIGVTNGIAILGRTAIVTCLRGQRIYLVGLGGPVNISSERIAGAGTGEASIRWRPGAGIAGRPIDALVGRYGRIRDAINAPDGSIWLTTSNRDGRNDIVAEDDRILRLTLRKPRSPSPTTAR
ncbi:PQQ-dependent sugar dehydrogenase [Actinopolymorpha sp. B11F2]|uniref:PQQ-dependent sugar dehydrogenase n=1 Tax=Actinopolymorpha sp. B11F2 TaxID=3160862 RepID=UPI0032E43063